MRIKNELEIFFFPYFTVVIKHNTTPVQLKKKDKCMTFSYRFPP